MMSLIMEKVHRVYDDSGKFIIGDICRLDKRWALDEEFDCVGLIVEVGNLIEHIGGEPWAEFLILFNRPCRFPGGRLIKVK